ncbi:hypothetical protein R3P38DRAFT_3627565 [Favolaschia claudopus]|uniref:Uncharacterized protein n=1 Tax=Favolaschia claudopus TaxID=2862362 RepID=A0AAW0A050_9AGAR
MPQGKRQVAILEVYNLEETAIAVGPSVFFSVSESCLRDYGQQLAYEKTWNALYSAIATTDTIATWIMGPQVMQRTTSTSIRKFFPNIFAKIPESEVLKAQSENIDTFTKLGAQMFPRRLETRNTVTRQGASLLFGTLRMFNAHPNDRKHCGNPARIPPAPLDPEPQPPLQDLHQDGEGWIGPKPPEIRGTDVYLYGRAYGVCVSHGLQARDHVTAASARSAFVPLPCWHVGELVFLGKGSRGKPFLSGSYDRRVVFTIPVRWKKNAMEDTLSTKTADYLDDLHAKYEQEKAFYEKKYQKQNTVERKAKVGSTRLRRTWKRTRYPLQSPENRLASKKSAMKTLATESSLPVAETCDSTAGGNITSYDRTEDEPAAEQREESSQFPANKILRSNSHAKSSSTYSSISSAASIHSPPPPSHGEFDLIDEEARRPLLQMKRIEVDAFFNKSVYQATFRYGETTSQKQILREKSSGLCSINCRYGFLYTEGHIEEYITSTEEEAMEDFRADFKQQTGGHPWEERFTFVSTTNISESKHGQYHWVGHSVDNESIYPQPDN